MFFYLNKKKPTKRGIKRGPFFLCGSSYDRDKQNEREYFVQDGEPADTDQHLLRVLVGVRFLFVGKEDEHEEGETKKTAAGAYRKRDKRAYGAQNMQRLKRAKGWAMRRK